MDEQTNSYFGLVSPDGEKIMLWRIGRLWELVASLPVQIIPLAHLADYLDEPPPGWETTPSLRGAAEWARRVHQADLSYPIIRSADGVVLDGRHRIAKAWMLGYDTINAVQFVTNPEPDAWLDPRDVSLPDGKISTYIPPISVGAPKVD